jgi:hypothetical protein
MSDLPFKPLEASEVFKIEDFKSIVLFIIYKNLATNMTYNNGIEMTEFTLDTVTLLLPPKSNNTGQHCLVEIYKKLPNEKSKENKKPDVHFTGKVLEVEVLETLEIKSKIKLVQYEEKEWLNFLKIYENRQEEIENFFKAVRGY